MTPTRLLPLLLLLTTACDPPVPDRPREGPDPESCSDGLDNDRDGDLDCEDEGCADSEACTGVVPFLTEEATPATLTTGGGSTLYGLSVQLTWHDDGLVPLDIDGDATPDLGCEDSVDLDIVDPLNRQVWSFGYVNQTTGWSGEDCRDGLGAFNWCHVIGRQATLHQTCTVTEIEPGATTFAHAGEAEQLTFVLESGVDCYTWGANPSYYVLLGCLSM